MSSIPSTSPVTPIPRVANPDDSEILMFDPRPKIRPGASYPMLVSRLPRLDESAGVCLRRSVLLRNAMLSSLEQERIQLAAETRSEPVIAPSTPEQEIAPETLQEAEWFDDLLSELSGQTAVPNSYSSSVAESLDAIECQDEDDFVRLDHPSPTEDNSAQQHCNAASYSQAGHAEQSSQPVASYCLGYPNVCPYPSVSSLETASSEELPALVDDDSDLEDDDDDEQDDNDHHQESCITSPILAPVHDHGSLSCPLSPVLNSDPHTAVFDAQDIRELFSPDPSRPTSPESSTSSKGGPGYSPPLESQENTALPSLACMSLRACTDQPLYNITDRLDPTSTLKHAGPSSARHLGSASCTFSEKLSHYGLYQPAPRPASVVLTDTLPAARSSYPGFSHFPSLFTHDLSPSHGDGNDSIVLHWSHRS